MTTNYKLQTTNYSSGFTLVETMVAITILLIAVVGPMSAIGGSLRQINTARDQMIAVNLAQEGIEIVRQKRDSNMLACWNAVPIISCATWVAELSVGEYIVDTTTSPPTLFSCGGTVGTCAGTQPSIYQDTLGMYHQYSVSPPGTKTKFNRVVNILDTVSNREKRVTATVTWTTSGGVVKTITVSESIFGINS